MKQMIKDGQVVILKANFALRMKIGRGKIKPKALFNCRRVMEENAFDFAPLAQDLLKTIRTATENCADGSLDSKKALEQLRIQTMQFKANAATFHYPLLTEIAQKLLVFLDQIKDLDILALDIVRGFHETATKLIDQREEGQKKAKAQAIPDEFERAIRRYWERRKISS